MNSGNTILSGVQVPGPARVTAVEFAKLRRVRIGPILGALVLGTVGLSLMSTITSAEFADPATRDWRVPLAGLSMAIPLLSPLLVALLASRVVEIEHDGNGWLLQQTAGLSPGTVCRAKAAVCALLLSAATAIIHLTVWAAGRVLGIATPVPEGLWIGFAFLGLLVNLVILALHLLLAAKVENQLIGLGVGVLGTVLAAFSGGLPTWFAHATVWGHHSLIAAADYTGTALQWRDPDWLSVLLLAALGAAAFFIITAHFDRQES